MESQPAQLHLQLLGPPDLYLGDRRLKFPTRKTLALLVYLALEKGPQPRESLTSLLWPDSSSERSHASLRNTLGHLQTVLRQASGAVQTPYLSITHDTLALNLEAGIELDLQTVEQAYALARADRSSCKAPEDSASLPLLQAAASCHRGDFLAGFSLADAPGFDEWADIQREVWHRRLGLILDRLTEIQFASGDFAGATETAAHWIALDVLNEFAYRLKMRAHFAAGERGLALETFEACRAVLAAELHVEPDPDTEGLAASIRSQLPPRPAMRSDTPAAFLETLLAGRARGQQVLMDCYQRAATGQPQVMLLHGEAGMGKTRLAAEFLAWVSAQDTEVLQGEALESCIHMPFQPLLDALRLRFERGDTPQEWLGEKWLAPLSRIVPELRQCYPDLPPSSFELFPLKADADQGQLFEPFVGLTLALARKAPLVIFLDDLQWADSATLDLLQYAVRRWRNHSGAEASTSRIMLLASLRSEAMHPAAPSSLTGSPTGLIDWLVHIERELTPCHLELEPLSESETIQMVMAILSPPAVDFAEWMFAETRGQPFYLMETLKDMLERRVLHPRRQAEGRWTFEVDAEHDLGKTVRVPSTVSAVIRSRLNRLSPNAFSLLAAGAVLEQRISFERLCAIANLSEDPGLPALDELISIRLLLEAAQPESTSEYAFANDMIRNVVYTEAGDARRRLFHRRALEILEGMQVSAGVLAHHALAAGMAEAAFHYSLAAGRDALRLGVVREAIVYFEQARRLLQDSSPPEPFERTEVDELYLLLGRAYEQAGQTEKSLRVHEELERIE